MRRQEHPRALSTMQAFELRCHVADFNCHYNPISSQLVASYVDVTHCFQ